MVGGSAPCCAQMLNWKKGIVFFFFLIRHLLEKATKFRDKETIQRLQHVLGVWKANRTYITMAGTLRKPRRLHTERQQAAGPAAFTRRKELGVLATFRDG